MENWIKQKITVKNLLLSLCSILVGLLLVQVYLSYKFPVKQDLFGHLFREHQGDRFLAYMFLLKSDTKYNEFNVEQINRLIEETAGKYNMDAYLIKSIVMYESYYLPNAISTTGAMGLMALMPKTAKKLGVQIPFDPRENIDGGVRHVEELSEAFQGDISLILAGYNAGLTNVQKYNGVPPFRETMAYVKNVRKIYNFLRLDAQDQVM